jgi:hypothetical protein
MSVDFYGKRADGTAIILRHDHPRNLNMSNLNARAFLEYLGLPYNHSYLFGEADIHAVRRAIIKGNALIDKRGLTHIPKSYVQDKLKKFSATVETLGGMGATVIYWA